MFSEELLTCAWHYFDYNFWKELYTEGDWIGKTKDGQQVWYDTGDPSDAWNDAEYHARWAYKFYHDGRNRPYTPRYMQCCCDYNNLLEVPFFLIDWDKHYQAMARNRKAAKAAQV